MLRKSAAKYRKMGKTKNAHPYQIALGVLYVMEKNQQRYVNTPDCQTRSNESGTLNTRQSMVYTKNIYFLQYGKQSFGVNKSSFKFEIFFIFLRKICYLALAIFILSDATPLW